MSVGVETRTDEVQSGVPRDGALTTGPPGAILCLAIPLATAAATLGLLAVLGAAHWPGVHGGDALKYCEAFGHGVVGQPVNTWSNLGFLLVGLGIGWTAWQDKRAPAPNAPRNRFRDTVFYPASYASVVVLIGAGSIAMHASDTWWSSQADSLGMYLWIVLVIGYSLTRLRGWRIRHFLGFYLPAVSALGVYILWDLGPGTPVFTGLIVVFAALELLLFRRDRELDTGHHWMGLSLLSYTMASVIWLYSRTGEPLCAPHSMLQGHALWHLLGATSLACIYAFYRSEVPEHPAHD